MMWLSLGTPSFFMPVLSWMTQCLPYIFLPLDSQVMSSHAHSYQSMMPVNAPQVNATTMVVVLINASRVGPVVGLPDSPSRTLLPPSLAGWLWPFATERSSFCHWLLPEHLSFIFCVQHTSWNPFVLVCRRLGFGEGVVAPKSCILSIESRMYESTWSWRHLTESWEIFKWFEYFYS
jgi:hypothetical protein